MIPSDIQVGETYQLNVDSSVCLKCGLWKPYHGKATYLGIRHDTHIFRWKTLQQCDCGEIFIEYHETVQDSLIGEIEDSLKTESRSPESAPLDPSLASPLQFSG